MIQLSLLFLVAGQLALALPALSTGGGLTCVPGNPKVYVEDGGEPRPVAAGTVCGMENGVPAIVHESATSTIIEPVLPIAPAEVSESVAPIQNTGVLQILKAQVPLGHIDGPAACPTGVATITATAPRPLSTPSNKDGKRFVAYWSAWHGTGVGILPSAKHLKGVTHLILAFWNPETLNTFVVSGNTKWDMNIAADLKKINPEMKVMVAVGGWNLDEFFRHNATDANREGLAQQFVDFVEMYKLDGIDVDWEYPVSNGASYLTTRPQSDCDKPNNILLMQSIRNKLEALKAKTKVKEYVLSLAVPALKKDMLAYDQVAVKEIDKVVDFWNLMSYDTVNRRSEKTDHHAGGTVIKNTIDNYVYGGKGVDPKKLNIGYPMYAKFFYLKGTTTDCTAAKPIGCNMGRSTFENGQTGSGTSIPMPLGAMDTQTPPQQVMMATSGSLMFNSALDTAGNLGYNAFTGLTNGGIFAAWKRVQSTDVARRDEAALATSAFDEQEKTFFTWLTGKDVKDSCDKLINEVGGVMAWSIDQDDLGAEGGEHFAALQECVGAK